MLRPAFEGVKGFWRVVARRTGRVKGATDTQFPKVKPTPQLAPTLLTMRIACMQRSQGRSIVELKRIEQLLLVPMCSDALTKYVIGVIEQWNEYASTNGILFGFIFNGMFLWAIKADGNNNIELSRAYRYNATNPTVLQVVDCVTYKALREKGVGHPWVTRKGHPRSKLSVWAPSASGRMETVSASLPQRSSTDQVAAKPPAATTGVTQQDPCAMNVDQRIGPFDKESIDLELTAANLKRDYIYGVLGRGAFGAAFMAAKRAAGVPKLLLAGPMLAFWAGYGIGTAVLPGRRLQLGDRDLLPTARAIVQRIHAKGIIHGDLRKENFVVMQRGSERSISLIDFSHCRFTTDASAQWLELWELERLFDAL
ncbi:hypothetical protein WJX75_004828 [Coccomyxa subellipsoidea]|uniref:Non-specific serine/threonine protein kinase n=1 Tax=Coccomyxa subellipsoidea TaxID=248742 RepID=A0ABR2YD64_9CHLO